MSGTDIIGKRFGRLLVVKLLPREKGIRLTAECQCDCGTICNKRYMDLVSGSTKSCKCLVRDTSSEHIKNNKHKFTHGNDHNIKHNDCNTSEYKTYGGMKTRCLNPNATGYEYYGGRGITISDRWLGDDGYQNFINDMGRKPSSKHTLDRINVDGNYEPTNCRWATWEEQANNKTNNKRNRYKLYSKVFDFLEKNDYLNDKRNQIEEEFLLSIKKK